MTDLVASRVTIEPGKMSGLACIRGYRMPVVSVLRMLGTGWSREQILADWPWMTDADISAALIYAARTLGTSDEETVMPE